MLYYDAHDRKFNQINIVLDIYLFKTLILEACHITQLSIYDTFDCLIKRYSHIGCAQPKRKNDIFKDHNSFKCARVI